MVLKDLIGKEVIWKGNKCPVLKVDIDKTGANVLQLKAEETETTKAEPWVDIDEVRVDVYFTARPRLFGTMVDAHDGYAKVEWQDADGLLVPFRKYPRGHEYEGQLMIDKENRPIMTMKIFDCRLDEISLY
jgi:hypothetical protein